MLPSRSSPSLLMWYLHVRYSNDTVPEYDTIMSIFCSAASAGTKPSSPAFARLIVVPEAFDIFIHFKQFEDNHRLTHSG